MSLPAMLEEFLELVQIESYSRKERFIADALTAKLLELDFEVTEDEVGGKIGGNAGNLIAHLPGDKTLPAIMFSAHMDRVENHGQIKPVVDETAGLIKSDGSSILAADDISGVCAILEGLRLIKAAGVVHGDIEVVFSVAEEVGLLGARHLDYSLLKSKIAYVIDSGGPVGTLINQAPTQYTIQVRVYGKSAHAGIEPEAGLSAIKVAAVALSRMREGRLSPSSTANFGIIHGGKATNIVCDLAEISGEARSSIPSELSAYLEEVKKVFVKTAAEFSAAIEVKFNLEYETFRLDENDEAVQLAVRAMANMGIKASVHGSGGGMDGNYFNSNGIRAVGIAPGYRNVHTSNEEQAIGELEKCGRLVAEIIKEAAKG
jgi:tripeptide aminopeptidase